MSINSSARYAPVDEVQNPPDPDHPKPYRLWRGPPPTPGKDIVILVHGAVVPFYLDAQHNALHRIDSWNNDKFCFYRLDSFLYDDFGYNVFTFEYADMKIYDFAGNFLGLVNYGNLRDYGESLIEAIGLARKKSKREDDTVGKVNIIAHSMGGLIARYAVQDPDTGPINKLITLDTGHKGFNLAAIVDDLVVKPLKNLIKIPTLCSQDVEPHSTFLNALINLAYPPLVSLAAKQPIIISELAPLLPSFDIRVVDLGSSNMGDVHQLDCSHMSIAKITKRAHPAYEKITEHLP